VPQNPIGCIMDLEGRGLALLIEWGTPTPATEVPL